MPKQLNEKERRAIERRLVDAASESVMRVGIKRTTVDELVRQANIPKGTFYLFFASKEELIFQVLMRWHESIHESLEKGLAALSDGCTSEQLTDALMGAFGALLETAIPRLMVDGEMDALIRRLPDETVSGHITRDELDFDAFTGLLPPMSEAKKSVYSAAFRALFFTIAHKREIGEEVFEEALRCCVRGIAMQLMQDDNG